MTCSRDGCDSEAIERRGVCASHWAEHMREYRATLKAQKNGREFHRGAEAMRQVIVEHMEGVGLEHFNGHSAAEFARRVQLESVG